MLLNYCYICCERNDKTGHPAPATAHCELCGARAARVVEIGPVKFINVVLKEMKDLYGNYYSAFVGDPDPATMGNIQIPRYQRCDIPHVIRRVMDGLAGPRPTIPQIELGARYLDTTGLVSYEFDAHEKTLTIWSPVTVIDGRQRAEAARRHHELHPDMLLPISFRIHHGTDHKWEWPLFEILNMDKAKTSSSVLLRNHCWDSSVIRHLLDLTGYESAKNKDFVLWRKVCWDQAMVPGHKMTGVTLIKVLLALHTQVEGVRYVSSPREMPGQLANLNQAIGLEKIEANLRTFFGVFEACWGILKGLPPWTHLKLNFMRTLARVFSAHRNFWDPTGTLLQVPDIYRSKLEKINLADDDIRMAASTVTQGNTLNILFMAALRKGLPAGWELTHWDEE